MMPIREVVVIVPAHNERERIGGALAALNRSARTQRLPVTAVIVLDACDDGTGDLICPQLYTALRLTTITVDERCAASARDAGFRNCTSPDPSTCAVLSTDADSTVPSDWIRRHVRALDDGYDAVAGCVDLAADLAVAIDVEAWRSEYQESFSRHGSHSHVHAANLSVRLDVLQRAGGFGHLQRAEDIDLWRRIERIPGARLRSDHTLRVTTSGRLTGRVHGGFSTALHQFLSATESSDDAKNHFDLSPHTSSRNDVSTSAVHRSK